MTDLEGYRQCVGVSACRRRATDQASVFDELRVREVAAASVSRLKSKVLISNVN